MPDLPRQHYSNTILAYFSTMDAFDMDAFTALLSDSCTISCETHKGVDHLASKAQMREFFGGLRTRTASMSHTVHEVIVDLETRRAACDLTYHNDRVSGDVFEVHVSNQFDFAEDGRIARVRYWLGRDLTETG